MTHEDLKIKIIHDFQKVNVRVFQFLKTTTNFEETINLSYIFKKATYISFKIFEIRRKTSFEWANKIQRVPLKVYVNFDIKFWQFKKNTVILLLHYSIISKLTKLGPIASPYLRASYAKV